MKNFFSAGWNIIKFLLVHILMQIVTFTLISIGYGVKLGVSGNVEELDAGIETFLANNTSLIMFIAAIGTFFVYKWMLKRRKVNIYEACRFNKLSLDKAIVALVAGMAFVFLSSLIIVTISPIIPESLDTHMENMEGLEQGGFLWYFLYVAIMAPFFEEVLFRGVIFNELENKVSIKAAIIISSILFGLYHMNLVQGIYTAALGMLLGFSLIWTGSIWAPILIHLGNNLFSVVLGIGNIAEIAEENTLIISGIVFVSIFIILPFCANYLYKRRAKDSTYLS